MKILYNDGSSLWVKESSIGIIHRIDGPAVIGLNRHEEWYVNNIRYRNNKSFQEAANLTDVDMLMISIKYGDVK